MVQRDGGKSIGLTDEMYLRAGAQIVDGAEEIFKRADMIIKVKEPQPAECAMLRPGQVLYTYLHLAPDPEQTRALVASGATCIAYETVTDRKGGLPLLAPMSEVAGRMSIQAGAHALEKAQGGSGVLLGGVPGSSDEVRGRGGVGGIKPRAWQGPESARDIWIARTAEIPRRGLRRPLTKITGHNEATRSAPDPTGDGAVMIPAPPRQDGVARAAELMQPARCWRVAIDRAAASRPASHNHQNQIRVEHHPNCVAKMPGVSREVNFALTNATMPFAVQCNKGKEACDDAQLLDGRNVHAERDLRGRGRCWATTSACRRRGGNDILRFGFEHCVGAASAATAAGASR